MTAKIYPYLTFKNAKEAMDYYAQAFGAVITYHQSFNKEQAENLGMATDESSLQQTTLRGNSRLLGRRLYARTPQWGLPSPQPGFRSCWTSMTPVRPSSSLTAWLDRTTSG